MMTLRSLRVRAGDDVLRGLESSGERTPIVLLHGNSGCAELFDALLRSPLAARHRVLALSLCGHGKSPASRDPDATYSVPGLAALTARALATMNLERCVLVGHSLGGHVLTAALPLLSIRVAGLMLISAPPLRPGALGTVFRPDPTRGALFSAELSEEQVESFADGLLGVRYAGSAFRAHLCRSIRATDPNFRAQLGQSLVAGRLADEESILADSATPTACVYGTEDAFIHREAYTKLSGQRLWQNRAIAFPGSGHSPHWDAPAKFADTLSSFVSACLH